MNPNSNKQPNDEALRPHSYDGIQEYDKRLPNWWLFTLYGAIIFAAGYWAYFHWTDHMEPGWVRVQNEIAAIKLAALSQGKPPSDEQLWDLSLDPKMVAAGEKVYVSNCVACHGADLHGGIGQNLVDATWIHGGDPMAIFGVIRDGVRDKGMPTWGPILGQQRMAEVVAFIISKNPTIKKPAQVPAAPPNET